MLSEETLALPPGVDARQRWRRTAAAHESFLSSASVPRSIRRVVLDSWRRSARFRVDPDKPGPPLDLDDDELDCARRAHPLHAVMPAARDLLVEGASMAGVIVAVGDTEGRMLWVEGNPRVLSRAESIHAVPGALWSEETVGTNAIGTALAVDGLVQVYGSEHYARNVHPWSCTAAPIRDPLSGRKVGFLTIAGRDDAVSPQSALLVRSAIAVLEAQLGRHATAAQPASGPSRLHTLGRDGAELVSGGRGTELSLRHSELLFLLSLYPQGLTAAELAVLMYERHTAEVTVRAELSRLRKTWPRLLAPSRPYRMAETVETDAAEVAECLQRGAHRRAVELYRGPVLPRSDAPAVVEHRRHLHRWLRQALLRHAAADLLLQFARSPMGRDDPELWQACLNRLPYGSPRRTEVQAVISGLASQGLSR